MSSSTNLQALQRELKKAGFTVLTPLKDHGFFSWKPQGSYKELCDIDSASKITSMLTIEAQPKVLVNLDSIDLPHTFGSQSSTTYWPKYPFGQYETACLHVASQHRSVNFNNIDFVFGGSTLNMLARKTAEDKEFMAVRIPHTTRSIMVVRTKQYLQDLAHFGFQFERLVTGQAMDATTGKVEFVEHVHEMMVGLHRVLFQAESDCMDHGELVEVKASNPSWWDTRVMFQMIGSGSTKLCHGVKQNGTHGVKQNGTLTSIELKSLSDIANTAFQIERRSTLEANLLSSIMLLQDGMKEADEGQVYEIAFSGGSLQCYPTQYSDPTSSVLPPPDVVRQLMKHKYFRSARKKY